MRESISRGAQEQAGVDRMSHVPIRTVNYDVSLGRYESDVTAQTESPPKLDQNTDDRYCINQILGTNRPALIGEAQSQESPVGRHKRQQPVKRIGCNP